MNSILDIDGWIIAGGASSRMGEDKAALEIGGCSLIELAGKALSKVAEGRISIAGEPREFVSQWPAFPDKGPSGQGPLSGVSTALSNGSSEWVAVISCDMPFTTGKVLTRLVSHIHSGIDAVVPIQPDGFPQPLCALYRRKPVLAAVQDLFENRDRSLRYLLSRLAKHYVPFSAFKDLQNADHLFLNLNSPAEYRQAITLSQLQKRS